MLLSTALHGTFGNVGAQPAGQVQVWYQLDFPMSGGQTCVIFCSKVLPSSSDGQSAVAVTYILGGPL